MRMKYSLLTIGLALPLLNAQDVLIDTSRSTISVHVGKAGLFSKAAHDHWINAPISSGTIRELGSLGVEFKVETARLTVKPDPNVDAKTQAQIQKDMEEMTLEPKNYPEISFRSTRIEASGAGQWKVNGDLSLHGVTKPISFIVIRNGAAYIGDALLRQTDFGIKPISIAGGMVKVKNEIDVAFQIYAAR
jgi:hypothetical protein